MKKLSEILDMLIIKSGYTSQDVAKKIGVANATLHKIKTGETTNPTLDNIIKIADFFEITLDQLTGKSPLESVFSSNLYCIPLINPQEFLFDNIKTLTIENYSQWRRIEARDDLKGHDIFAIKITGEAMAPVFDETTIAIIDKDGVVKNRSLAFIHIAETNEYIIRKLIVDGSQKLLKPYNSEFQTRTLDNQDKILGVVIASQKDFD